MPTTTLHMNVRENKTGVSMSMRAKLPRTERIQALMPAWTSPAQQLANRLIGRCSYNAQHQCSVCNKSAPNANEIPHRPDCPLGQLIAHMEAANA
jgi:hypothetical protein